MFYILSSNHPVSEMMFDSMMNPASKDGFKAYGVSYSNLSQNEKFLVYPSGRNFSAAGFVVHMVHQPASFILQYFIPSFAMPVVSWVSFVIPPDAIPGRTGLLVTLFLVLSTMFAGIQVL